MVSPTLTKEERVNQVSAKLRELQSRFEKNHFKVKYKQFNHHIPNRKSFWMNVPEDYVSARLVKNEESKEDDHNAAQHGIVAAFFDPDKHTPSNKMIALCRVGQVKFAYHIHYKRVKGRDEFKTVVYPVALKVMDQAQLQVQGENTVRELEVLQALRPQGFSTKRFDTFQCDAGPARFDKDHEHFPQWKFLEDTYNQYMLTDFAANGSLMSYTNKRIRQYSSEIAHMASKAMVGVDSIALRTAVRKLWREEALSIFAGIARAVAFMHSRNVCHLDLCPCNIVIDAQNNPILVDFGSSEVADKSGRVGVGRPILCKEHFCSPQVATHNRPSPPNRYPGVKGMAADMYGLGVLLYWLLFIYAGDNEAGKVVDPIKNNPQWLKHLTDHIHNEEHSEQQCAVCVSPLDLDGRLVENFQVLLAPRDTERPSAQDFWQRMREDQYQLAEDFWTRCARVLNSTVAPGNPP
ncbi:hypothetical protein Poli38472_008703 [Pythium oligandrum]|uniref:non-specific serine/threonine protein kinase n=1 Tax=Pythium oligandrum TaxID=41045 RepID=A0A8K1FAA3_PYTOL|nr:hypothetical protein Poli38472_008703 [Pythium oligandrum]|eukprot:TMW56055.1 hypothetical protein Poli38472_008703 [Pythium oligandrum]